MIFTSCLFGFLISSVEGVELEEKLTTPENVKQSTRRTNRIFRGFIIKGFMFIQLILNYCTTIVLVVCEGHNGLN